MPIIPEDERKQQSRVTITKAFGPEVYDLVGKYKALPPRCLGYAMAIINKGVTPQEIIQACQLPDETQFLYAPRGRSQGVHFVPGEHTLTLEVKVERFDAVGRVPHFLVLTARPQLPE